MQHSSGMIGWSSSRITLRNTAKLYHDTAIKQTLIIYQKYHANVHIIPQDTKNLAAHILETAFWLKLPFWRV